MKKAKIMLSAIAVIGIVAGALAFKAKSAYSLFGYYKLTADKTSCPYVTGILKTTTPGSGTTYTDIYLTTGAGAPAKSLCSFTTYLTAE